MLVNEAPLAAQSAFFAKFGVIDILEISQSENGHFETTMG